MFGLAQRIRIDAPEHHCRAPGLRHELAQRLLDGGDVRITRQRLQLLGR
jgi:integrase